MKQINDEIKQVLYSILNSCEYSLTSGQAMAFILTELKSHPLKISKQVFFFLKRNKKAIKGLSNVEIEQAIRDGKLK